MGVFLQLKLITGQSNGSSDALRQFYDLADGWTGHWVEPITAMQTLITHLEEAVDYPPQWVSTSHENLVFVGEDDYRTWRVSVHPCHRNDGSPADAKYKIRSRSDAPWSYLVGFANDEKAAGEMIVEALSRIR